MDGLTITVALFAFTLGFLAGSIATSRHHAKRQRLVQRLQRRQR